MGNRKHVRLNSVRDIQKLLSKVLNQRMRGEIDGAHARDVGYLAKIILDSMESEERGKKALEQSVGAEFVLFEPVVDNTPLSERDD